MAWDSETEEGKPYERLQDVSGNAADLLERCLEALNHQPRFEFNGDDSYSLAAAIEDYLAVKRKHKPFSKAYEDHLVSDFNYDPGGDDSPDCGPSD